MWTMMKEGGGLAMLAALVGVIGALLGIVAASMLGMSRRSAFVLGLVTLSLVALTGALGAGGVVYGRHQTENALSGLSDFEGPEGSMGSPSGFGIDAKMEERIRAEGYSEAAAAGRIGAMFAALPLLLGAAAAFGGAGAAGAPQPMPPPGYGPGIYANVPSAYAPPPKPGAGHWILAGVFSAVALVCVLASLGGGMTAPYPNPDRDAYGY